MNNYQEPSCVALLQFGYVVCVIGSIFGFIAAVYGAISGLMTDAGVDAWTFALHGLSSFSCSIVALGIVNGVIWMIQRLDSRP